MTMRVLRLFGSVAGLDSMRLTSCVFRDDVPRTRCKTETIKQTVAPCECWNNKKEDLNTVKKHL
jgi:hypothetical protein